MWGCESAAAESASRSKRFALSVSADNSGAMNLSATRRWSFVSRAS